MPKFLTEVSFSKSLILIGGKEVSPHPASKNINKKNNQSKFIETDVSDFNSVNDMVNGAIKQFGPPDILINNAGITGPTATLWLSLIHI